MVCWKNFEVLVRLIDAVADSDEQGLGDNRRGKSDHRSPHLEAGCAYRKSNPGILVVQSAQDRAAENASNFLGGA
jgi:hypothetical protein